MLNKGVMWKWTNKCKEAFNESRKAKIKGLVLTLSDIRKPFDMDVLDFAVGGVLLQEGNPVVFESDKLSKVEIWYIA